MKCFEQIRDGMAHLWPYRMHPGAVAVVCFGVVVVVVVVASVSATNR